MISFDENEKSSLSGNEEKTHKRVKIWKTVRWNMMSMLFWENWINDAQQIPLPNAVDENSAVAVYAAAGDNVMILFIVGIFF